MIELNNALLQQDMILVQFQAQEEVTSLLPFLSVQTMTKLYFTPKNPLILQNLSVKKTL